MVAGLEKSLAKQVDRGKLEAADRDAVLGRVRAVSDLGELADCDLVLESIVEDLATKKHLFSELDRIVREGAILATNTSTLPVVEMAMETGRPELVCGIHFFNPAPMMPLVEVVRAITTSDETVAAARAFAETCGKNPVEVKDQAGFIVNALLFPYLNNAVKLLDSGVATREDIDAAMQGGCNFPMGPLALLDLVGLDTSLAILEALYAEFKDPNYAPGAAAAAHGERRAARPQERPGLLRLPQEVAARPQRDAGCDSRRPALGEWRRDGTRPALGDPDVLRPLVGPGVERAVPQQPRQGPDRPLGRVRPARPRPATTPTTRSPAARSARSACRSRTSARCGRSSRACRSKR